MIAFSKKEKSINDFTLVEDNFVAELFVEDGDYWGVKRAVEDLKKDIKAVSGKSPELRAEEDYLSKETVFIGTIGKNRIIDHLIAEGKLDVEEISGKWESFT